MDRRGSSSVGLNKRFRFIIISALPEELVDFVIIETTTQVMWTNLCIRFEGTKEVVEKTGSLFY